jgi:small-conductance mechanosensitive channel
MDLTQLSNQLKSPLAVIMNDIVAHLPNIAGAILLLLAGWLVAYLVRQGSNKLLSLINQSVERMLTTHTPAIARLLNGVTQFLPTAFFWITLFIFTTAALRVAGLTGIAESLRSIIDFLPSILAGGLIMLTGYILASLVKNIVLASLNSADIAEADALSRLAQTITFVTAIIIGLDQIGIEVTFLTTMLGVSTAAVLVGFALAFGLGSRSLVSNLVAVYYTKGMVQTGQKIRIGDIEGTVLELSATTVILDTAAGRTSIPAKLFQEEVVTVLTEDHHDT